MAVSKKRRTKKFRQSKKAQEYMNMDIQSISGGSRSRKKRTQKRKRKNKSKYILIKTNLKFP
jgi:hypothetical protein